MASAAVLPRLINVGEEVVADLQEDLRKKNQTAFYVSDVTDPTGKYQYVDLVQEGGGVLGIALLGYTYVLERMGIRFLHLAGTSAGAINTMMLSAIQSASVADIKSPVVLHYLSSKKLFDFVDGHPITRWLIRNIVGYKDYAAKTINSIIFSLVAGLSLLLVGSILLWQSPSSVLALSIWVGLAVGAGMLIYGKNRISDGILKQFLQSNDFVQLLAKTLLLILACWALQLPWARPYQIALEGVILFIVLALAVQRSFSASYLPFIQRAVAGVLATVFILWALNRSHQPLEGVYSALGTVGLDPGSLTPYAFLSIAGVSLCLFFILFIGSVLLFLLARFNGSQFGINPGENFRDWITDLLRDGAVERSEVKANTGATVVIANNANEVETMRDFERVMSKRPQLVYRGSDPTVTIDDLMQYDPANPPVTFITAEIATENKIELPRMWPLFWASENSVCPADFVRASMSIPVFFEAFRVKNIPKRQDLWRNLLGYDRGLPDDAVFMDGGILSNFPINLFYRPDMKTARLPTFGVRLDDRAATTKSSFDSLGSLVMSMFNTTRYYYDKDFLIKHPQYANCIGVIDVREFDWLNFNLSNDEKLKLFRKGAETAAQFLRTFDWNDYKAKRTDFQNGKVTSPATPFTIPAQYTATEARRIWPKEAVAVKEEG
ncbi:patatin-like phospholipase family protein [Fibrella aquatilis]|uniref:Patatin-like phospholipase family protein n=1 Tax=Fibrella aquatilis TaxID=2817059 RepID=A0A939G571_9BACT|nr:patatin-like phospholipase family protein [Fibrella aquatilis]MBO0930231.1 patatin-like phospholipase family protein [Fibrella aquatilis]